LVPHGVEALSLHAAVSRLRAQLLWCELYDRKYIQKQKQTIQSRLTRELEDLVPHGVEALFLNGARVLARAEAELDVGVARAVAVRRNQILGRK